MNRPTIKRLLVAVGLTAGICTATVAFSERQAEAKPKGDAVRGSGTAGTGTFNIDAQAKKNSAAARGSAVFSLAIGEVQGRVTCVVVNDGLAAVGGKLVTGTTAVDTSQSPGFIIYIADSTVTTSGTDLTQLQFGNLPQPDNCTPQFPFLPARVTEGDIVLIDAT